MIDEFIGVLEIIIVSTIIYYLVKSATYKRKWGENP